MCYRMGGLTWCASGQRRHRKMHLGRQQPKGFKRFACVTPCTPAPVFQTPNLNSSTLQIRYEPTNIMWPGSGGEGAKPAQLQGHSLLVTADWWWHLKFLQSMEKADVLEMVNLAFQGHHKGNGENKKLKVLPFHLFYVHNCPYEYMCSMCVPCS